MGSCVFLGIWGLEIHIFVVNVHFFPGRGQHLPGKCVFFPKSGNLCRVFKRCVEGPSAGYRMADRGRNVRKNRFFNGETDHSLPCTHATMPPDPPASPSPQPPCHQPAARPTSQPQPPCRPDPSAPSAPSSKCHQGGGVFLA